MQLQGDGTVQEDARLLFAVSALCRNNPAGATAFLQQSGLEALAATARHGPRLFIKAITLLTDLIIDEVHYHKLFLVAPLTPLPPTALHP